MATLSIVVPASNVQPTLEHCLDAIGRSAHPVDEVVVVSEPDDAVPARLRNLGASRTTGDILVFVDADVALHEDSLSLIRTAFADGDLDGLFGSYDDAPGRPGVVSTFRNLLHHYVHQSSPGDASTFWTGIGAVRRDAFEAVGGFDERIESMEDVDLGMRLNAAGRRLVLDPRVQGKHLKRWTLWSMVRTDFSGRAIPWVALLLHHRSSTGALNLGWRHRASAILSVSALLGVVSRRWTIFAASAFGLIAVNREFYALLLRRGGRSTATAGVALHALHHLVAIAAVPFGIRRFLRERGRPPAG